MQNRVFSPVAVVDCPDYSEDVCRRAIAQLAEKLPLLQNIAAGTKVVIKVNLVTMLRPEKAATTHPSLLFALVEYLSSRGVEVVIGDGPGGTFDKAYLSGVYRATGMNDAAAAGASLNLDFEVREASYPEAKAAKTFEYTAYLDKADLIINFCKLKSHGMMAMSCAVKNMFGVIPGLTKAAYHYRFPDYAKFADMLIDLNEYFHPVLNIVDAVVAMEGNGPTMGTPRPVGALLASESPYTLDLICAKLIGLGTADVPTLAAAAERGLAPESAEDVTLLGDISPYIKSDFEVIRGELEILNFMRGDTAFGRLCNHIIKRILQPNPKLKSSKCIGCQKCAGICPAKAITMKGGKPHINRDECIRCFCCQEFCPVGALESKRSALGQLIMKGK